MTVREWERRVARIDAGCWSRPVTIPELKAVLHAS